MAEPVDWSPDGTPRSPRFADLYPSAGAPLEQARHVFLEGCDLPAAWAGREGWRILETGFGLGLNFLAAWRAWKDDPRRPRLLHFVSVEAWPVSAQDIVRGAASTPEVQELARELAAQWWGLVPGWHRLQFEGGQVLLTLCVGDVRKMLDEQSFAADSVFLDGFEPRGNPAMWELDTLKAVARCCRRGTQLATWTVLGQVRRDLAQCGFQVEKVPGLPPKRERLRALFDPAWTLRRTAPARRDAAGSALVVGGGLAGAAAAASLARRGWRVEVLDAANEPAAGASGLPAGLLAPHTSPDDNQLSRLSRAGVRMTLQEAGDRLVAGQDWQRSGVLERREAGARLPAPLGPGEEEWQQPADEGSLWHAAAAWVRPGKLVRAWLAEPGVAWRGGLTVRSLANRAGEWVALDEDDQPIASAEVVVVAAALGSAALLDRRLTLHPVRGQVSWNLHGDPPPPAAPPRNGHGHFLPDVPLPEGRAWLTGSTYGRGETSPAPRAEDQRANLERLRVLDPEAAARLAPEFQAGTARAWVGVRCASSDRRPLVGELAPGLWVSTAMGSRGLTFARLAAELLAARLQGEPLPLPARLAAALDAQRSAMPAAAAP
ncbi:tRNA (5-methylaminomethyl-2-thiouridine)(34)-methyltransferase MnmD [Ramlibacter sp. Leaf400]|uniref:tRNA (5-methylaminomethyl-2-thiouridine)(34)-methyltransferase MnmD n=1 Tax=Ramlibacter sp. Leaf400 TaxID=1736365 RepID=UPI0006F76DAC|nr:tRNA (5-methylaminomethyl-2-thiouridine)(34)-methyltransferase MnmD [Ramlibacter sp. Leaf400]KQT10600.1 FAD-dependent cmnm(5)s(2)U34 oxidoreductase [Ramlibacter sp. Leaf400]